MHRKTDSHILAFADGFTFRNGALHCGGVAMQSFAEEHATPLYVYNTDAMVARYREFAEAMQRVPFRTCFAVKANSNLRVLEALSSVGCGMDVNSRGELYRAVRAGVDPESITMTGVGKTDEDIRMALETGILFINAESIEECRRIQHIALGMGVTARIVLRINPDVNASTHSYIATGLAEHKFGMGLSEARAALPELATLSSLSVVGFGMHLGSQLFEIAPYKEALEKVAAFTVDAQECYGFDIRYLNIGGGMGVSYADEGERFPVTALAEMIASVLQRFSMTVEIVSEPGRYLTANAGIILTQVVYVKQNAGKTFLILDAGMNNLIRPALYQAEHVILPVQIDTTRHSIVADIVGPVCESGDTFRTGYQIQEMYPGEYVAIFSAGAYGSVMSSRYNSRPLPAEWGVRNGAMECLRKPETLDDMVRLEI